METISLKNDFYFGSNNRKSQIDLEIPEKFNGNLILFAHGYIGFKDWGAWNLMQDYFVNAGFGFSKFNFSHNGGTFENGIDFPDLKAFSENSYSKEVFDLQQVLNFLSAKFTALPKIILLGHSRGGAISLLKSGDSRVSKIVTLASISSIEKRFSDQKMIDIWKKEGVRFVENQRTKQQMPHSYSQVEDFLNNSDELSIQNKCENLEKSILIFHGNKDLSVPISEGEEIAFWSKNNLQIIENTDHVFGSKHPWQSDQLPEKLKEICEATAIFILEK
jgi:pimeloyl-ACP methyl ester carboxylesterase